MMKKVLIMLGLAVIGLALALIVTPAMAVDIGPITVNYGTVALSGGFQAGNFPEKWNLTACDMTISATYDATGLVDDLGGGAHAWGELGIRQVGAGNFNPGGASGGKGVWVATDYDWAANTFDPDPPGAPIADLDDKLIVQRTGGQGENAYDLPSVPSNPWANYAVWFDRDGVDQWQAQMWGAKDGITYNTNGRYEIVITLHANDAGNGTAFMTVNGESQGFYVPNWRNGPPDLWPAGMTFTGDMTQMQVFYGMYGYGATHSITFEDITVTGCLEPAIAVDKSGPALAHAGEPVTYSYAVTNPGDAPLSNVSVSDDICSPVSYVSGDDGDSVLEFDETWNYTCTHTPSWKFNESLTNTVTASGDYQGNGVQAQDSFTLYPLVLRKSVFLYWGGQNVPYPGDTAVFDVEVWKGGSLIGNTTVSAATPTNLWLGGAGTYTFKEVNLPAGYQPGYASISWTTGNWPDTGLINVITFDLAIEKGGPDWAYAGDAITYSYTVTNAGPAAVTPVVEDDTCSPVSYVSGDTDTDGKIDAGETWLFECTTTPTWDFNAGAVTNTATVRDAEKPDYQGWLLGGDRNKANNSDSFTLYPFVLRKDLFLYWDSEEATVPYDEPDNTAFDVAITKDGNPVGTTSVSQAGPTNLWLSAGSYNFKEVNVPTGYLPAYPDGFNYTTGEGYPDWTFSNVVTFDLAIEKSGPVFAHAGDAITYRYTVSNAGPAAVTPVVEDDTCSPVAYVSGDADSDGLIDPSESWLYQCTTTPAWAFNITVTNTATVHDAEKPDYQGWLLGGDRDTSNNSDSYTLYSFVLRKKLFLYWDSEEATVPYNQPDNTVFSVEVYQNGGLVGTTSISQAGPTNLWLGGGSFTFKEVNLPFGYLPAYPDGFTYTTGEYPDMTFPNVITYNLHIYLKWAPAKERAGNWVYYLYKVYNVGPAVVTPVVRDDRCGPATYWYGDTDSDGFIDPGEMWVFKCKFKIPRDASGKLYTTATVQDAALPTYTGWYLGGDRVLSNNTVVWSIKVRPRW